MIYQDMQRAIEHRYDLNLSCQVKHFVSHDQTIVHELTGKTQISQEMLLIREEKDTLDVTLFLEEGLIESVSDSNATHHASEQFDDYCTILEGVSHFVYLIWNAQYGRQIKPIEMELQAEVDKFIFAALADSNANTGENHKPCAATHKALSDNLFRKVSFTDAPGTNMHYRYKTANDFALRYCKWLTRHYQIIDGNSMLNAELARFYRLNGSAKFDHIKHTTH